jgi:outer membrane PBP1 activator LpoA protein
MDDPAHTLLMTIHSRWDKIMEASPPISELTNAQRKARYDWLTNQIELYQKYLTDAHDRLQKLTTRHWKQRRDEQARINLVESEIEMFMNARMLFPH